jgi:hypothetical protein
MLPSFFSFSRRLLLIENALVWMSVLMPLFMMKEEECACCSKVKRYRIFATMLSVFYLYISGRRHIDPSRSFAPLRFYACLAAEHMPNRLIRISQADRVKFRSTRLSL